MTPEQISAANKANMETLANLSRKAFEGVEKLMELNIQVAKTMMSEQVEHMKSCASAKDAQDLMAMQAKFVKPFSEKIVSYSRHLKDISTETQTALSAINQEEIKNHSEKLKTLISDMTSTAPNTPEAMKNLMKQAVANATTVFESSQKAVKQAVDMTKHQTETLTKSAMQTSEKILKKATK